MMLSNMHINDARLIIFTIYLFSCVKFSWNQLILKIYCRRKFPNLRQIFNFQIYVAINKLYNGIQKPFSEWLSIFIKISLPGRHTSGGSHI